MIYTILRRIKNNQAKNALILSHSDTFFSVPSSILLPGFNVMILSLMKNMPAVLNIIRIFAKKIKKWNL